MAYSNRAPRSASERSRAALSKGYDRISKAVERSQRDVVGRDTAYLIEWLVFEAALLVRSGRFNDEASKLAVEKALVRASKTAKRLA